MKAFSINLVSSKLISTPFLLESTSDLPATVQSNLRVKKG